MEFKPLDANGPVLLIPKVFGDNRGYFFETFRQNEFEQHCGKYDFVQDNQSKSSGHVLRGLHYQLQHPQGKLVHVIVGSVFDVVIDIRRSSPHFGKSYTVTLNEKEHNLLWVPPGFAHGFFVLSDEAIFTYKCTDYYDPSDEYSLLWDDPVLGIDWPLGSTAPKLSEKDKKGRPLQECPVY